MAVDLKKHYPKDWVVLQNRVAECFRGMSLDEKRLFIMSTPLARTTQISSNEPIFISSHEFSRECNVDLSTAYTALETASERLFTRFFGYTAQNGDRVKIRWLNKVVYKVGQGLRQYLLHKPEYQAVCLIPSTVVLPPDDKRHKQ